MKRAFLVLAPESHGGHLVTELLVAGGCTGSSGDHVDWRPDATKLERDDAKPWENERPSDVQPWDLEPPRDQDPIVWRRSVPHGGAWPDLTTLIAGLRDRGYDVNALVVTRDHHAAIGSQLKWQHVADAETGRRNVQHAYLHIFSELEKTGTPCRVVSYEALVHDPRARDCLLLELGLAPPAARVEVWDGNRKWYDPGGSAGALAGDRRVALGARAELALPDPE